MHRSITLGGVQQQLGKCASKQAVRIPRSPNIHHHQSSTRIHRDLSTTQTRWTSRDLSSIDSAYMPQHDLELPRQNEILRVPILPENSTAPGQPDQVPEFVHRPEIATVSANGTHIDNPSAMSEVTDNHAIDMSPFDLTRKVTNAAAAATSTVTGMPAQKLKEPGVVQELISGLIDDVFGAKKLAKA